MRSEVIPLSPNYVRGRVPREGTLSSEEITTPKVWGGNSPYSGLPETGNSVNRMGTGSTG